MKVVVATHGHCFDGLASAVVFTRLLRRWSGEPCEFHYHGCGYGIGQQSAKETLFDGQHNAILDYRFTATERLTWYFDHHRTAFASSADRQFFEARRDSGRYFYEPDFSSCTKLIAEVGKRQFGLDGQLDELVEWADIIDSAAFSSAAAAIDRSRPEMQLVSVVEQHGNDALITELVRELEHKPLIEVARSSAVQERYQPIARRLERFVSAVKSGAQLRGRVVLVDLTESTLDLIGKFVTYALYPRSVYSVVVARLKRGYKISVGYNPWCGKDLDADISAICARYGGGGHPVVGGISVPDGQRERAQAIATSIARELDGGAPFLGLELEGG